jgi:dienelactone hydrolase
MRSFVFGQAVKVGLSLPAFVLLATLAASAQTPSDGFDPIKARGTVVKSVACLHDPTQNYALYLPSQYSPDRRWPIIYAFDPFARGAVPVELYKDAAEKYGYIVAGSNNAKNGPGAPEMAAAQAVWQDTHERFSLDKNRVYTTGLSGGARFATSFALYCYTCSIAGVIAHGAGYPVKEAMPANDHFVYYVAIGDADFNYPEIMRLRDAKEKRGAPFKVKIYPGPHQWAPKDVVEDAFGWIELKAMQAGTEKPNPAFIQRLFEQTKAEAAQTGQRGDVLAQFYALRSLAVDFKGLEDVGQYEKQFATLRSSKALKKARHQEDQALEKQRSLTSDTAAQIGEFGAMPANVQSQVKQQILATLLDLRRQAKSKSSDHLVFVRALNQLWIQGIEDGQEEFRNHEYPRAAAYFELMAAAAPDQAWPMILLAETRVREGDKKAALKALEEAVKRGLKNPRALTQDPELTPLATDPDFQRIVQGLEPPASGEGK